MGRKRSRISFYLNFLTIVAASLAVYFPSFEHTFRADQVDYFANTRHCDSLMCLWTHFYAYEHVRYFGPGDACLFRPLLSLFLGFERAVFNTQYTYWHITCFALHMLTVWFLFKILDDLKGGIFALLGALIFACSFANTEMVIWEHINGYMLFNALILAAFYYFKKSYDVEEYRGLFYIALALLMAAAFFHEFGSVFALMFGVCFYFKNKEKGRTQDNKKAWLFVLPGLCYAMAYVWVNAQFHNINRAGTLSKIFQLQNLFQTAFFVPSYSCHIIIRELFPSGFHADLYPGDRLEFFYRPMTSVAYALNVIALGGILYLVVQGLYTAAAKRNKAFVLLMAAMGAFIFIALPFFRLPTHHADYLLEGDSYYGYMLLSFYLVLPYLMTDCSKVNITAGAGVRRFALASMVALILLNGYQTWELNRDIKTKKAGNRQYFDQLNSFIALHRHEQGFSFYVQNDPKIELDYYIKGSFKKADVKLDQAGIFYFRYYQPINPKYTVYFYEASPGRYLLRVAGVPKIGSMRAK